LASSTFIVPFSGGAEARRMRGVTDVQHLTRRRDRIPAPALLAVSAVFHYLGPAFAVLLFAHVDVAGVAWLRIAGAAVVFAVWRRLGARCGAPPSSPWEWYWQR
jgi:hypothetical protein